MALQPQTLTINFAQGLNTKVDAKQLPIGKFLELENSIFTKEGLLQKRNGYGMLQSLPDDTSTFVTTFNGNLTAVGGSLSAYSPGTNLWSNKGSLQPCQLEVLSLIRSNLNQSQADAAVSANGLVCTTYINDVPQSDGSTSPSYKYAIANYATGQNIIAPTTLAGTSGTVSGGAKVWVLGNYFVIVFPVLITATNHLQYIAVSTANPTTVIGPTNIASNYLISSQGAFEGVVSNNNLYLAWNATDGGGAIRVNSLSSSLTLHSEVAFATTVATTLSVAEDVTTRNIYIATYDSGTQNGYAIAVDQSLNTLLAATKIIDTESVVNITGAVINSGTLTFLYEISNNYSYDSTIPTHYIKKNTVTSAGTVGTASTVVRSVGLASKAFMIDGSGYVLSIYSAATASAAYQPTCFLIDFSGNVILKLAYSNSGPYYTKGLPNVTVQDNDAIFAYFIKDLVTAVNKTQGASNPTGISSQLGINLATVTLGSNLNSAEIGANLHFSGGFLWSYDGFKPVEQGFHLWPDNIKVAQVADPAPTATTTSGSANLTSVSATTNIVVGMHASGVGIQAGSIVTAINGSTITLSKTASASGTVTVTFTGEVAVQQYFYQVTYEWSDNQGNVFRSAPSIPTTVTTTSNHSSVKINIPTLRLTYKTTNAVKIVIYRYSAAQQTYYQITSNSVPLLNDTTVDSVSYTDLFSDAEILGNTIIYTTGGVLENIAAPACSSIALLKSRLFLIDSEDENILWFSKTVSNGVPVEMSDLLAYYVAPTTGAQGSTGPSKCLAALDDKNIVFKKNAIYYFTGVGPDSTGANNDFSEPVFITSTVGCENQRSIVMIPSGLMFQSGKGIWLLGRDLSTNYIGAPVEDFTEGATVLSAISVPNTNQVRFTLDSGITLMYDYYYNQWGSFTNVKAISNTVYEDLDTYINSNGEVFQETPSLYLDGSRPVSMRFKTGWINLAGVQGYQRAYFFYLLGSYLSPHKVQMQLAFDYNDSPLQSSIFIPDMQADNYGNEQLWGSNGPWGGADNGPEQGRIFLQQQKCQAFQITMQELYDPSFGVVPGAGFTMSGLTLKVGVKSGTPRIKASRSVG